MTVAPSCTDRRRTTLTTLLIRCVIVECKVGSTTQAVLSLHELAGRAWHPQVRAVPRVNVVTFMDARVILLTITATRAPASRERDCRRRRLSGRAALRTREERIVSVCYAVCARVCVCAVISVRTTYSLYTQLVRLRVVNRGDATTRAALQRDDTAGDDARYVVVVRHCHIAVCVSGHVCDRVEHRVGAGESEQVLRGSNLAVC
jgi:hypothetical protein